MHSIICSEYLSMGPTNPCILYDHSTPRLNSSTWDPHFLRGFEYDLQGWTGCGWRLIHNRESENTHSSNHTSRRASFCCQDQGFDFDRDTLNTVLQYLSLSFDLALSHNLKHPCFEREYNSSSCADLRIQLTRWRTWFVSYD